MTEWKQGNPHGNPFGEASMYVLKFEPYSLRYFHAHLFKPDYGHKCFRSVTNKSITFPFDLADLYWCKVDL